MGDVLSVLDAGNNKGIFPEADELYKFGGDELHYSRGMLRDNLDTVVLAYFTFAISEKTRRRPLEDQMKTCGRAEEDQRKSKRRASEDQRKIKGRASEDCGETKARLVSKVERH